MIRQSFRLLLLLSTLAFLTRVCVCRPSKDTNAERFARGLPPLRPQRLYNATRTGPYLSRRSALPTGFLLGIYPSGSVTPFCYVGLDSPGSLAGSCVDQSNALMFTSSQPESSTTPASLQVTSPHDFQGQLLTAEAVSADQGSNSLHPVAPINVETVSSLGPGAQPAIGTLNGFGSSSPVSYETDVFYISADGSVSAIWVNPAGSTDGANIPLYFWLYGANGPLTVPAPIYSSYSYSAPSIQSYSPIPVTMKVVPV